MLQSKGLDPCAVAQQLHAAGRSIGSCAPQHSRIISIFTVDASRRTFKFSGLQALPADVACFAHCDICTNQVRSAPLRGRAFLVKVLFSVLLLMFWGR
jgi:hypothetical protein